MNALQGTYVPVPTPFTDDGSSLSEIRLARWLHRQKSIGGDGFVVGGDAGEFTALTFAERKQLLELFHRVLPIDSPFLAHITTLSTAASIDLAHHAAECGAQAGVIMPPYYGRLSDAELRGHFQSVVQHGRLPLIVVDPFLRIQDSLRRELSELPEVFVASPYREEGKWCFDASTPDEFACGNLALSPLAMFEDSLAFVVRKLVRNFGAARVAKAVGEQIGLELGPLRGPMNELPAADQEPLREHFREAA